MTAMDGEQEEAAMWGAVLTFGLFELPQFIMQRKMMLTIKACAERSVLDAPAGP